MGIPTATKIVEEPKVLGKIDIDSINKPKAKPASKQQEKPNKKEEPELVEKIRTCDNDDDLEKIFDDYVKGQNLKN